MDDNNLYTKRWKPKINVKQVAKSISELAEIGKQIIKNADEDFKAFYEDFEKCIGTDIKECGVFIDNTRLRLIHRMIQYYSLAIGALCTQKLIPTNIIDDVYEKLKIILGHDDIKPQILRLTNPSKSVWPDQDGNIEKPKYDIINPEEFILEEDREAWVFIHGMLYKALKRDGSDFSSFSSTERKSVFDFFADFEKEAEIFKPSSHESERPDSSKIDIYLVNYDSEIRDEDEEEIKIVLESYVLENGNFYLLIAAVYWKEMERRAKKAATYIKPFLEELVRKRNWKGRAFTHSLGCYVLANAAEQIKEIQGSEVFGFQSWWCMNAAMTSDSFSNTGEFKHAPMITPSPQGIKQGTSVWYSLGDVVLMLLFPLCTCTTALGFTGLGINDDRRAKDHDITFVTDVYHGPHDEYMKKLGPTIREALGTNR
ncbi:hypothetical protein QCQ60_005562 [Bacillus cereus]|nr:hypothetical protein [Bacillus cereus]